MPDPWSRELAAARTYAVDTADLFRRAQDTSMSSIHPRLKSDRSPVTDLDVQINRDFIEMVRDAFPSDGVLGEETSCMSGQRRTWVIDPIDGTQQMLLGIPVFMISIALVIDGEPVVGVAHNPSTHETYWATLGSGAFLDGRPLRVSRRDGHDVPAIVCASGADAPQASLSADALVDLHFGPVPHMGMRRFPYPTVFSGCKVAEGAWDADLYSGTDVHDVAAVARIVAEAGGQFSDRHGRRVPMTDRVDGFVLSNGKVHDRLVALWTSTYRARS